MQIWDMNMKKANELLDKVHTSYALTDGLEQIRRQGNDISDFNGW